MTSSAERDALAYLKVLAHRAEGRGWFDLRFRPHGETDMRQRFVEVADAEAAARVLLARAREQDAYVGVAIRRHRGGGKASLGEVDALWVDCDTRVAVAALERFVPAPAMVVRSSARGAHAYWPLTAGLSVGDVERANRRLAHALGGCQSAVVNAAAILRPPGTWNLKYEPSTAVQLVKFTGECFAAREVVGGLADPPLQRAGRRGSRDPSPAPEPLLEVEPRAYVEVLTARRVRRDGKVHCPLHPDSHPSFHCYSTGMAGWFCFGCDQGGDVYDLGELVLGIPRRGRDFFRLRGALYELLLPGVRVPRWQPRSADRALR